MEASTTINAGFATGGHIVSDDTYLSLRSSLKRLGAGIHREVYALDADYVIKYGNANGGTKANRDETAAWLYVSETEYAGAFNPVVAASPSGAWIVSPRVKFVARSYVNEPPDFPAFEDCGGYDAIPDLYEWERQTLREIEAQLGLIDTHHGNLGFTGDRWVIIDYGFGIRAATEFGETDGAGVEPSFEEDGTCHCESCELRAHRYRSCWGNKTHPRACRDCGASDCHCSATTCKVERNTAYCEANVDGACVEPLHGRQTFPNGHRLLLCADHWVTVGPVPDNWDWPRLFATSAPIELLPDGFYCYLAEPIHV